MKRDLELIRKLLFFFDVKVGSEHVDAPSVEGYDIAAIKYHLILLHDAGYLRCEPVRSSTSERVIYVLPFDLTWDGHEFLDKVRNPHIWEEVMDDVKKRGFASASVEIIKRLADAAIRQRLELD